MSSCCMPNIIEINFSMVIFQATITTGTGLDFRTRAKAAIKYNEIEENKCSPERKRDSVNSKS